MPNPRLRLAWWLPVLLLAALWLWQQYGAAPSRTTPSPAPQPPIGAPDVGAPTSAALPPEAIDTLRRIQSGGPFAHRQDGGVFQNRERRLPAQARGYYREYTVDTPGSRDRGARRIVAGGKPPSEFWYTDDHYRSFRRVQP